MPKYFDDPGNSTHLTRAIQAYIILVGLARNRQTITYGDLGAIMKYGANRGSILFGPLGHIMYWCHRHDLPPLTALVVERNTGLPNPKGLITVTSAEVPARQQDVFRFDWCSILPPTEADFRAAHPASATAA